MPVIELGTNLDDIQGGFETYPEGDYRLRVNKWELKTTDEGKQYIIWTADIFGNDNKKFNGKKMWFRTFLGEASLWYLKMFLEAAGGAWTKKGFDPEGLLGKEVGATVTIREFEGEDRNEVKKFMKI